MFELRLILFVPGRWDFHDYRQVVGAHGAGKAHSINPGSRRGGGQQRWRVGGHEAQAPSITPTARGGNPCTGGEGPPQQ